MVITLVIAIITFILFIFSIIFFPKIKIGRLKFSTYVLVALLGAILMLITQRVNFNDIFVNIFDNTKSINPVKILCLFFSMSFISIFLEQFGFFKTIASYASKKAKKNQFFLFVIFYLLTSILTIFTSNDIVILTLTPFLCYFCKNAKLNTLPYLISEFAAANTWSMMLIIGNPTNMYLGGIHNLEFISFLRLWFYLQLALD